MSKDTLRIDLYGDVRIIFNDEDITQKFSKKSIGLIAYLLCTPSQQASKNTLKDLLWIDAGEKAAYNLRFNLWNIKKNIPEVGGENFIITSGNLCRINPNYPIEKNIIEKLENLQSEISLEDMNDAEDTGNRLVFMEHFYLKDCDDFNDWLTLERNNRERRLIAALARVEDYLEENIDFKTALNVLEKMMFLSPFEDDFHIKAMKIYAELGNYGEAAREYKNYSEWLKKELGVAPSKNMRDTYLSIARNARMDTDGILHVKDKVYDSDFAAAAEMLRSLFPDFQGSIPVKIDNWKGLDQKSQELFEALAKEKIVTIGR